jgi:hypothetical protein
MFIDKMVATSGYSVTYSVIFFVQPIYTDFANFIKIFSLESIDPNEVLVIWLNSYREEDI